jgi:hypothetical protein
MHEFAVALQVVTFMLWNPRMASDYRINLEVLYTDMALLVNKIKRQPMMILVGILIIILSLRTLSKKLL